MREELVVIQIALGLSDTHTYTQSHLNSLRQLYTESIGLYKAKGLVPKPAVCDTGLRRRSLCADSHTIGM